MLSEQFLRGIDTALAQSDDERARRYPGPVTRRQPVHTVYIPADRFDGNTVAQWGATALAALTEFGRDDEQFAVLTGIVDSDPVPVLDRMRLKLASQPIEDVRVDLEDGYGLRPDDVEDRDAVSAGRTLASSAARGAGTPFCGVRIKCLEPSVRRRSIRSVELVIGAMAANGGVPAGFVFTLPKVTAVPQVEAMAAICGQLERDQLLSHGALRFEIQIETTQAILGADGTATVAKMLGAADGRCTALHYGTYDYSAAAGVSAAYQSMEHAVADHAKAVMQVAAAGTGVALSDGSTNIIPVGNREQVHAGWALHARLVRRHLERGYYQGWDLHPAQLPTRFAATYAFYRSGMSTAAGRLRRYLDGAASGVMDEPATAQALAGYLCRGLDCGAVDMSEVQSAAGVSRADLDRLRLPAHLL
jgi:citrate lyase beta subunit